MSEELGLIQLSARAPAVSMRDVLLVIFRQRRLLLISFVVTFLAVLLYGVLRPSYQAQMKVLVRRGRIDPVVTSTPTQPPLFREEVTEEELNSEVELLRDEQILHQVVKTSGLGSEGRPWFWESATDNQEVQLARAVSRMENRLKVVPVRKTALIAVTYGSSDPARAAQVLNTLASAYLERHLLVRRPSGEFNFFEQQVIQSRRGLEEAASRLIRFTRDQNVVSAGLERDLSLQKLVEADASNRQTHVAISETIKRIRALEWTLQSLPERTTTQLRSADNPQLLEKMKSKLLELELKRRPAIDFFAAGEPEIEASHEVRGKKLLAPIAFAVFRLAEQTIEFRFVLGLLFHVGRRERLSVQFDQFEKRLAGLELHFVNAFLAVGHFAGAIQFLRHSYLCISVAGFISGIGALLRPRNCVANNVRGGKRVVCHGPRRSGAEQQQRKHRYGYPHRLHQGYNMLGRCEVASWRFPWEPRKIRTALDTLSHTLSLFVPSLPTVAQSV
jgi:hypothetical protein